LKVRIISGGIDCGTYRGDQIAASEGTTFRFSGLTCTPASVGVQNLLEHFVLGPAASLFVSLAEPLGT
jgi:hypothetical protein